MNAFDAHNSKKVEKVKPGSVTELHFQRTGDEFMQQTNSFAGVGLW